MKNKKLIYTEILLLFCIIFASVAGVKTFSADTTPEIQTEPESQFEGWVYSGGYAYTYGAASGGDDFDWSFIGTNTGVGLYTMAMDYINFLYFENSMSYTYYELSDGNYIADSGTFDVPYTDTWYIVFYNLDAGDTYLTWDGTIWYNYFGGTRIDYNMYGYSWFVDPLQEDGTVDWDFECTNNYVGIDVMAMDDTEFSNFVLGYSFTYYELSDGGYSLDSGTFTVPHTDNWYFVFANYDPDEVATDLNWGVTYSAPPDDEYEDNDYLNNAAVIDTETWYFDLIAYDDDCYAFYMETGETATVDILFADVNGDLDLYLYDSSYNELVFSASTTDDEYISWTATYSGDYIICVDTAFGTNDNYDLYVDIEVPDDEYEDNDFLDYPAYIDTETWYFDLVALDDDVYAFYMGTGDVATVDIYFLQADGDLDLYLYNSTFGLLTFAASTSDNEYIGYTATYSGYYLIGVDVYYGTNDNYDLYIGIESATPLEFTIDASSGSNGDIDPSGLITVTEGDDITFTFDPDAGYMVDNFYVDGVLYSASLEFTFIDVVEDHTIEVNFKEDPDYVAFNIDASSGPNGDIDPSGVIEVEEGDDITFTFDPDEGYIVDYVLVDGEDMGDLSTYTFSDVDSDHSIEVYFKEDPDYDPGDDPGDDPDEPFISGYSTYLLILVMGVSVFVSARFIRRRRMS